ncbi:MAG TPA: hypothetical protein PKW95_19290 [bacterium]|nr:hypothetical protein [bacterium]
MCTDNHRFLLVFTAVVLVSLLFVAGCGKRKSAANNPTPLPINFEQAEQVHQQHDARPQPEQPAIMRSMATQSNQECRTICKQTCLRGRQCNIPGFADVRRCAKFCLTACNNKMIPDNFTQCMSSDSQCGDVAKCLKDLRENLKKKRLEKLQENQTEQLEPEQPAPDMQ